MSGKKAVNTYFCGRWFDQTNNCSGFFLPFLGKKKKKRMKSTQTHTHAVGLLKIKTWILDTLFFCFAFLFIVFFFSKATQRTLAKCYETISIDRRVENLLISD